MSTEATDATDATDRVDAEVEAAIEAHVAPQLAHGEHKHPSDRTYVVVALILAVFTAAEVTISYLDIGPVFMPLLLTLMVIKFVTVVLYFMHLRFDHAIFGKLFWSGLILAVGVYCAALATFHVFSSSG